MEFHSDKFRLRGYVVNVTANYKSINFYAGFDLIEVGENEVILGVGKHVTLRMLQLALQAALAIFGNSRSIMSFILRSTIF
jgi:hypothetical protein